MEPSSYLFALALTVIAATLSTTKQVDQGNEALVHRFGRYHRKLHPGLNFGVIPFIDEIVVEGKTHEQLFELEVNDITTNDGVVLKAEVSSFWRSFDLYSAYYQIENVENAMKSVVSGIIRSKLSEMSFREITSSRESISGYALMSLDEATESWGVKVTRIEIQGIKLADTSKDTVLFHFQKALTGKLLRTPLANSLSKMKE